MQLLVEPLGHPSLSPLVQAFNQIGQETGIDPCLLAAMAEEESTWNKLAVSFDGNFGRGLMQIDAGFHAFAEEKIVYVSPVQFVTGAGRTGKKVDVAASVANGAPVFDAHENLRYACENLIGPALKHYAGRPNAEICAIASYNAGIGGVDHALAQGRPPESATFDPTYVPSILHSLQFLTATSKANQG